MKKQKKSLMAQRVSSLKEEKLLEHKYSVPDVDLNNYLLVCKVGTEDRPAGPRDIELMQILLAKASKDKLTIVTHHAVDFVLIPKACLANVQCIGTK